jgi:hypothetical protein
MILVSVLISVHELYQFLAQLAKTRLVAMFVIKDSWSIWSDIVTNLSKFNSMIRKAIVL